MSKVRNCKKTLIFCNSEKEPEFYKAQMIYGDKVRLSVEEAKNAPKALDEELVNKSRVNQRNTLKIIILKSKL